MFEALQTAAAAWRTIAHVAEWSGLSIAALAGGAALVAFVPLARKPVIAGAVLVLVGWLCVLHGDRVGRADVHAQWDDARRAAIAAEQERDAMTEQTLEQKYRPQLADLQRQSEERKKRADSYERTMGALLAKNPAYPRCELGAAAKRVPGRR